MTREEISTLNRQFDSLVELMYKHHRRQNTTKQKATDTIAPMQLTSVSSEVWKLFVGEDYGDGTLNYEQIDKIIYDMSQMTDGARETLHTQRKQYKDQFLEEGINRKNIVVDGVTWVVDRSRDLPWMIPVSLNYHNPTAVDPRNATSSEMSECGRMVKTNLKLYKTDPYYKNLIRLTMMLETQMTFDASRLEGIAFTSLWHSWQLPCFTWTKPAFKLYAVPYGVLNYNIFVGVSKEVAERNKDKIIIPEFTVMLSLTGEIRPVDLFVNDTYACQYYRKYQRGSISKGKSPALQKSQKPPQLPEVANLVCTLDVEGKRPGVGNGGFFANTTCATEPFFKLVPNTIGNKQANVVTSADFIYKHNTIIANRNFSGQDIINQDVTFRNAAREIQLPHNQTANDILFMPLEWPYGTEATSENKYVCQCLTNCIKITESTRKFIYMGNPTNNRRTQTNWNETSVNQDKDITQTRKEYIMEYLGNLKKRSDILHARPHVTRAADWQPAADQQVADDQLPAADPQAADDQPEQALPNVAPGSIVGRVPNGVMGILALQP